MTLCKLHKKEPNSPEYLRGQAFLEQAIDPACPDPDALASLAGTCKDLHSERACDLYKQAYEVAPSDPYAVGNYLAAEITYRRDLSAVPSMAPAIAAAIQRCRDQVEVGMNLPWASYEPGRLPPGAESTLGEPGGLCQGHPAQPGRLVSGNFAEDTDPTEGGAANKLRGYEWATRLLRIAAWPVNTGCKRTSLPWPRRPAWAAKR